MSKTPKFRKWVDWNRETPADVAVGKVIFTAPSKYGHQIGDVVDVACCLTTGAGRQYRVMGTNEWVGDYEVIANSSAQSAARVNLDNVIKNRNGFTNQQTSVNIKTVVNNRVKRSERRHSDCVKLNNVSNKKKINKMDKSILKTAISGLKSGDVIGLTFIGAKAHLTRDWTVVKVKTGKGKGGSKLMELVDGARNTMTTGTPDSNYILNLTTNGQMIGYTSEADVPAVFEKNSAKATELKEAFKSLKGAEGDKRVTITASVKELNGTFIVNKQTQLRGRGGQIRLDLARVDSAETQEVWSLRHSGIVQSFVIETDETV